MGKTIGDARGAPLQDSKPASCPACSIEVAKQNANQRRAGGAGTEVNWMFRGGEHAGG